VSVLESSDSNEGERFVARRTDIDGRELLLSAALKLFAKHGIDAVSIRAVNRAAGLGPASVHYHFGTKEALLEALLEMHVGAIREQVREGARNIAGAGDAVSARDLVTMLASPYLDLMDQETDGLCWVQLVSRVIQSEPNRIFDRSSAQLVRNAATKIYPDASRRDVDRVIRLCVGLLVPQLVSMKQDGRRAHDYELLIDFLTGGLDATLAVQRGRPDRIRSA
jgi:AcrR family transcriptional regulator